MTPIILASQSQVRAQILRAVGVAFDIVSSGVDEDAVKTEQLAAGASPREIAEILARAKAVRTSTQHAGLVIGADQTLDLNGALFNKATTADQARANLLRLRGKTHQLHSATAIAQDGVIVWSDIQSARLTMRNFSDSFLDGYIGRNPDALAWCVGGYEYEAEGMQLFEAVDGDYFTILGLPILPLLAELRRLGLVAP